MKRFILFSVFSIFYFTISAQDLNWAKQISGSQGSDGIHIATDGAGNVYTRGLFNGAVDFDPGSDTFMLTSEGNHQNTYILKLDASGNFVWAKQINVWLPEGDMIVDNAGTIYLSGLFYHTVDFDPGSEVFELTAYGANTDVFVLKLNTDGNFIWAKKYANIYSGEASTLALDNLGNLYCVFNAWATVDMDPGPGNFYLTPNGSGVLISKLDTDGNFLWGKKFEEGDSFSATRIASIDIDLADNLYIVGSFKGLIDFDPDTTVFNLDATGNGYDGFVVKLDVEGNFDWAKQITGPDDQFCRSSKLTSAGDIYIAGSFFGTTDFDPSAATHNLSTSSDEDSDLFICKLTNSGDFIWAKQIGNTDNSEDFPSITTDIVGDLYATGSFTGIVDFDLGTENAQLTSNGAGDIYVLKLSSSGNFKWAFNIGGAADDGASRIVLDSSEKICITGSFRETVDFDPESNAFILTALGDPDAFVLKLDNQTLSITENNLTDLILFPNPTNGNFTIDLGKEYQNVTVEISNILGQVISTYNYAYANKIETKITGSPGIYLVNLGTATGASKTFRIIKQ